MALRFGQQRLLHRADLAHEKAERNTEAHGGGEGETRALQADPDIDYIHFAFDGLAGGMAATLAEADLLEGRKLVGVDYNGAILQEIVDGTQQFWTTNPKEYSAWLMMDAMARHAVGMDNPEERANAILPTFLVNTPEVAEPLIPTDGWPGPEDQAGQFATLWGV